MGMGMHDPDDGIIQPVLIIASSTVDAPVIRNILVLLMDGSWLHTAVIWAHNKERTQAVGIASARPRN